jgi:hypothetical protein
MRKKEGNRSEETCLLRLAVLLPEHLTAGANRAGGFGSVAEFRCGMQMLLKNLP